MSTTLSSLSIGPEGHVPAGQSGLIVESAVASETIPVGLGVVAEVSAFAVTEGSVMLPNPVAASASALVLTTTALGDTTPVTWDVASFDGGYAGERLNPPRAVVVVTTTSTDWDAGTAVVIGQVNGAYFKETLTLTTTNGGETLTTNALFEIVESITFSAMTGTAPGYVGFAAAPANADVDLAGVVRHSHALELQYSGSTATDAEDYADGDDLALVKRGRITVHSENAAVAGDPVYVRHTSDGGSNTQTGKFRSTPDGSNCYRAKGWFFRTSSSGSNNAAEIERR